MRVGRREMGDPFVTDPLCFSSETERGPVLSWTVLEVPDPSSRAA